MIELKPYSPHAEKIAIQADFQFVDKGFRLDFQLSDLQNLVQKSLQSANWGSDVLSRADELWKETCFEAFWSKPGEKSYWELNISPTGKWNLYFFDDYRLPQPPKKSFDFSLEELVTTKNSLSAKLKSKPAISELEISICAVIKTANSTYYYSNAHKGAKPDFHLRENFSLRRKK